MEAAQAMGDGGTTTRTTYTRHEPESSVLHAVVREHLETFLATMREGGREVPKYVEQEFRAYLRCGVLACGFARVRCDGCGFERLVAFSCKRRGVCSSCGGRRMDETAANLVDCVLPDVPLRQYVLTVPWEMRLPMARDPALYTKVSQVLFAEVKRWQRETSGVVAGAGEKVEPGAVSIQHRGGGSLNLSPHWHVLVLDGVYRCRDDGSTPVFVPGRSPTRRELETVLERVVARLLRSRRWKKLPLDEGTDGSNAWPTPGAATGGGTFGRIPERRGLDDEDGEFPGGASGGTRPVKHDAARVDGFNLHASVRVAEGDLEGRARLCRYVLRPTVCAARFSMLDDGRIAYRVKYPRSEKATHRVMTPMELMSRLSALVPPPRHPLLRYQGVFAPHSPWRSVVVPGPRPTETCAGGLHRVVESGESARMSDAGEVPPEVPGNIANAEGPRRERRDRKHGRIDWATLLRRVWGFDILRCPNDCARPLRVISVIQDRAVIVKILEHLGLPTEEPRARHARGVNWDDSS